jgi:hypothetical protein
MYFLSVGNPVATLIFSECLRNRISLNILWFLDEIGTTNLSPSQTALQKALWHILDDDEYIVFKMLQRQALLIVVATPFSTS